MNMDFTANGDKPQLTLYKNPKHYPTFTESLTVTYGPKEITPRNIGFQNGHIDIQVDYDTIIESNYLGLDRGSLTLYAYIDRVEHLSGDKLFRVFYAVDPLRTYRNKLDLGNQFVLRGPGETDLYDEMLGSVDPYPEVDITERNFTGNEHGRVLVVQVRRRSSQGIKSNVPVNPSLYEFYVTKYSAQDPTDSTPIWNLLDAIQKNDVPLIVTMYSVPDFDFTGLVTSSLFYDEGGENYVSGFHVITAAESHAARFTQTAVLNIPQTLGKKPLLTRVDSSITLLIPDAGIINIPPELYDENTVMLRRDIDIFSGLSNYMLVGSSGRVFPHSVRGGAVSSIPIVSDPMEVYLSQNQNALATSVIGDVAMLAGGVGLAATGKGALIGGGMAVRGATGLLSTQSAIKDAGRNYTNPPAFMGSALAANFSNKFYQIEKYSKVTNEEMIHDEFGYPRNLVEPLTIPSNGFIQTQNCGVKSDGTIPQWAITEINGIFDNGLKVE